MNELNTTEIDQNIHNIASFLKSEEIDAIYIPSFDQNISEYVPLWNNLRYYVSGFKGSTADALVRADGICHLYVDGRYHLQADLEVKSKNIIIEKVGSNIGNFSSLIKTCEKQKINELGFISERTPIGQLKSLKGFKAIGINESDFLDLITFKDQPITKKVFSVDENLIGQSVRERLLRLKIKDGEALFLSAIDDLSWLTNLRAYQLPFLSSFIGKALVLKNKIHLFSNSSLFSLQDSLIEVHDQLSEISKIIEANKVSKVIFDKGFSTVFDFELLTNVKGLKVFEGNGLTDHKSIKYSVEVPEYERIFDKGSRAIFDTISWCKNSVKSGKMISELDLYNKTTECYRENGSVGQSFNTISGVGSNGAIVHYADPKKDKMITKEDLVLLDSGGYFESGLATDTTRTFLADERCSSDMLEDYKKNYTLVLKSQIQAESAVFPIGTKGNAIDMLARQPLYKEGLDFKHGLGHGVGVHVHEPGVRLSSLSNLPMKEGQLVSIEPGLYFDGKFGIRLENICLVEKHPSFEGFLRFRNLVFIGWERALIEENLLTFEEKRYLSKFEDECKKRKMLF